MTVDEIYHLIGQNMVDSITEDWTEAVLSIDRLDKYTSVSGEYKTPNNEVRKMDDSRFGFLFSQVVHELHTITTEGGQNKWNKLKAILKPDGKFNMEFIWDQEFYDKVYKVK